MAEGAAARAPAHPRRNLVLGFPVLLGRALPAQASWWDDPWVRGPRPSADDATSPASPTAPGPLNHGRFSGDSPPLPDRGRPARLVERRSRLRRNQTFPPRRHGRPPPGHRRWHRPRLGGLSVLERTLVKSNGGNSPDEYRVTKWLPMEVSLVDIPADATVGLGRSHDASQSADSQPGYRIVELPESGASLKRTHHGQ